MKGFIWVRMGDNAEYEKYDSPHDAGRAVGEMLIRPYSPGEYYSWGGMGFYIRGFVGHNYISVFWGDKHASPVAEAELNTKEKEAFMAGLKSAGQSGRNPGAAWHEGVRALAEGMQNSSVGLSKERRNYYQGIVDTNSRAALVSRDQGMPNPTVKATMENLKKYAHNRGMVMYSPITGEQYSATVGDYFWAPADHNFTDSQGNQMYLVVPLTHMALPRSNPRVNEELANEVILPWLKNFPGDKISEQSILEYARKNAKKLTGRNLLVNALTVKTALNYLSSAGEVLESDIKPHHWIPLTGGEGYSSFNPRFEKGKWPPINDKAIVANLALVFRTNDINKLNGPAYRLLSNLSGFIAHYNINGFKDAYSNLAELAADIKRALPSDVYHRQFDIDAYGKEYCDSNIRARDGILALANKYYPEQGRLFRTSMLDNPLSRFRCSICGAYAPHKYLRTGPERGQFGKRMSWLRRHYKNQHPAEFKRMYRRAKATRAVNMGG